MTSDKKGFPARQRLLLLTLAGTVALAACTTHSSPSESTAKSTPVAATAASRAVPPNDLGRMPAFTLKDTSGRQVSSDEFRGKVLLVDFWATWCAPCKREMPGYEALYRRYRERGFAVVGIAMDWDADAVTKFAREVGVTYPLLLNGAQVQQQFEILGLPTTFLVDREGRIRKKVVGFEYTEAFEATLKEIL